MATLDQRRATLSPTTTLVDALTGGGSDYVTVGAERKHVFGYMKDFLFPPEQARTPIGKLSGGERGRLMLARALALPSNVLVLDEPTNDLDLMTLGVLEEALQEFPGCALIVSHDRWFLDKVATASLAFEGDGRIGFYEGDYSSWAKRAKAAAEAATAAAKPAPKAAVAVEKPPSTAPAKKLSFKEKQELDGIETAIATAEARVNELQATLNDPTIYKSRAAEVPAIVAQLDAAKGEVDRLYARWQTLEALK